MSEPTYLRQDMLFFFDGKPAEQALYLAFEECLRRQNPNIRIKIQKTQISFYGKHLFAAISLRKKREWQSPCLLVTFGLGYRLSSPRIECAVKPYPNRWTHHVRLHQQSEIDQELMGFLQEAYAFSEGK